MQVNLAIIGHVTEILFYVQNTAQRRNKLPPNAKIQEADPLYCGFTSIRYVTFF